MVDKPLFPSKMIDSLTKLSSGVVGVFGGTFDPPHLGHLVAAEWVREKFDLDYVLFVVANDPWQKSDSIQVSSFEDRLRMVSLATAGNNKFVVSDIEAQLGGESTTYKTLTALNQEFNNVSFRPIIGADVANNLDTWRNTEELKEVADFIVCTRSGFESNISAGWKHDLVEIPGIDISSSSIRDRIGLGLSVRYEIASEIDEYIAINSLYQE